MSKERYGQRNLPNAHDVKIYGDRAMTTDKAAADELVSITHNGSTHARKASEWLQLARADIRAGAAPSTNAAGQDGVANESSALSNDNAGSSGHSVLAAPSAEEKMPEEPIVVIIPATGDSDEFHCVSECEYRTLRAYTLVQRGREDRLQRERDLMARAMKAYRSGLLHTSAWSYAQELDEQHAEAIALSDKLMKAKSNV